MTEHHQQSALLGKIAAYTELLVNDPRSTIFVSLAETYRKMGLFNDAREIVAKGLELHSDFGPAYVVLARIECQLENIDASCAAFEQALALDPDSLAALVGYARVKLLLHHDDAARELLLHARSLSPADPVINKMLLGLTPKPEPEEEAVAVAPIASVVESVPLKANNLTALASTALADLYLVQGLTDKALALYHQLLSRNPDNLELRRKIREIEGRTEDLSPSSEIEAEGIPSLTSDDQIDTDDQEAAEPLSEETAPQGETLFVPEETVDEITQELEDSSILSVAQLDAEVETDDDSEETADNLTTVEVPAAANDPTEIINKLNDWLNNIRLRREHV